METEGAEASVGAVASELGREGQTLRDLEPDGQGPSVECKARPQKRE